MCVGVAVGVDGIEDTNDLLNFCQVPGTPLSILHTVFLILTP